MTTPDLLSALRTDHETRKNVQALYGQHFLKCPACRPGRDDCLLCAGTRKVSRATARQLDDEEFSRSPEATVMP